MPATKKHASTPSTARAASAAAKPSAPATGTATDTGNAGVPPADAGRPAPRQSAKSAKPTKLAEILPAAAAPAEPYVPDDLDREIADAIGAPLPATGDDDDAAGDATEDQSDQTDQSDAATDDDLYEDDDDAAAASVDSAADGDAAGDAAAEAGAEERVGADELSQLRSQVAVLTAKLDIATAENTLARQRPIQNPESKIQNPDDEISDAETPEDLLRLQAKFQQFEDFAADNPEGAELSPATPGGEPRVFTAEQVRSFGRAARDALRRIPRQAQLLQQRAQFNAAAEKAYPDYANPKSDLARFYATYSQNPNLRAVPGLKLILADALAGMRAREAREKAAAGDGRPGTKVPPPARRAVPVLPTGSARKPAPQTGNQTRRAAAAKRLENSNGTADELAAMLEAEL